jgi:uncharacterized SAM-binding protein YcdF (DUF218 family)
VAAAALALTVVLAALALVPRDDEVPDEVDAVIALGGSRARVALAIEVAETHDAALVLSAGSIVHGHAQGYTCVQTLCLRPDPATTAGEARGMTALTAEHGWETVVVATSDFHVNRSRLLFQQCLDEVAVVGTGAGPWPDASLRTTLRELAGLAAGLTVARAC